MTTFQDVIGRWPSVADFAADIGVKPRHASQMRWRNSVSPVYWPAMIEGAKRRRIRGVTHQVLNEIYANREAA